MVTMNARTKLKRADQARKRRAKMTKPGWTKVSKRGAAVTLWEKDMVRIRPLDDSTNKRKPTPMPEWLERQFQNVEQTIATWSDGK
jgi:hypothetical protein